MSEETSLIRAAFSNTSNLTLSPASPSERAALANIREVFFTRDAVNIARILRKDLASYMSQAKAEKTKLVLMDELIPSFFRKICNVYDVTPIYKWADDEQKDQKDDLKAFWKDLGMPVFLQENFEMCRFNNISIPLVKWSEQLKRVHIDGTLHAGNCIVEPFEDFVFQAKKLTYFRGEEDDRWAFVWNLIQMNEDGSAETEHYKYKIEKNGKIPESPKFIPVNDKNAATDLSGPPYWPVNVYRYSERGATFWGNAMDSLVELVRAINILFTVCNDDSIRQTIRLLIMNFRPEGVDNDEGKLETGMENPNFPESELGKSDMKAEILEAKLFNEDIIEFVESLFGIISNTHNIGSLLKQDMMEAMSGIALRLKNEPLLRDWAHDINIIRYPDLQLHKTLVRVHNYHTKGDKKENEFDQALADTVQLDYQEPTLVTDDDEEYTLEQKKWKDGTSSPILWVMAKNPEFTEDEAKDFLKKNTEDYEELTGLQVTVPGQTDDEIIEDEVK